MGDVVEAEHRTLGHRVVVKLLRASLRGDVRLVERFRVEAQVLGLLDGHPHIVSVRDYGVTPTGQPYLAMERLRGKTLHDAYAAQGAFAPEEAVRVAKQVALALVDAHAQGIVHRDIKLANVFLCDQGALPPWVKVLDFGIAKVLEKLPTGPAPAYATEDGMVLGTPRYLAPEQVRGRGVGPRADIYALGILLYMLLAGRGPFDELRDAVALVQAHLHLRPMPPSHFSPNDIDPALEAVVLKALEKDPNDRYPTAQALIDALDQALKPDEEVGRKTSVWTRPGAAKERPPGGLAYDAQNNRPPPAAARTGVLATTWGRTVLFVAIAALSTLTFLGLFALLARMLGVRWDGMG